MSWRPLFAKERGFFSPANEQAVRVTSLYRIACFIVPVRFCVGLGDISTPFCAALGGFTILTVLYYVYAVTHQTDAPAQDAPPASEAR